MGPGSLPQAQTLPKERHLEPYHQSEDTDSELLPVVDENDEVVGEATRREIHTKHLLHRAIHIVVKDPQGRVLLQKRSCCKDRYPGYWDVSVGGHVDVGESYEAAAVRELREELGVESEIPKYVTKLDPSERNGFEFLAIFELTTSLTEFDFRRSEIDAVAWVEMNRFLEKDYADLPADAQVTPSSHESIQVIFDLQT